VWVDDLTAHEFKVGLRFHFGGPPLGLVLFLVPHSAARPGVCRAARAYWAQFALI